MTEKKTLPKTRKYEIFVWLFYTYVLRKIPYSFGVKLRNGYARKTLKSFGKYSTISTKVRLLSPSSIIGANSVVTKNIPQYCIAAGVPARVIKER